MKTYFTAVRILSTIVEMGIVNTLLRTEKKHIRDGHSDEKFSTSM